MTKQKLEQKFEGYNRRDPLHVIVEGKRHLVTGKKLTKDVFVDLAQVTHLQVCTSGSKYGNKPREGDRQLGEIFEKDDLNIESEEALARWVEGGTLKPRTQNDFEAQQKFGVGIVPFQYPVAPIGADSITPPPAGYVPAPGKPEDNTLDVPVGVTPAQKARLDYEAKLAAIAAGADPDEDEEEEEEEEATDEEPLVIDPRAGFDSKKAYWAEYKVSGKRAAVCGNCAAEHASVDALWECFETCVDKKTEEVEEEPATA